MTEHWQTLLSDSGYAQTDGHQGPELPANFSAPADQFSILNLTGPDTLKFLQGQVTCNVQDLSTERSLPGAACTPKGRAYVLFQLVKQDEERVLLRLPTALAENVRTHLSKYLAFFKAEMEPAESWRILGVQGQKAIQSLGISDDLAPGQVVTLDAGLVVGRPPAPDHSPRAELWLDLGQQSAIPDIEGEKLGAEAWHRSMIEAGEPLLSPATVEKYVPQNLNLHALDGISYNKGCYTGQEVVARMHFLGQLKKSLFRLAVNDVTAAPAIGTAILGSNGRKLGEIVDEVATAPGQAAVLAVLSHQVLNNEDALSMDGEPKAQLTLKPMGYTVPEQQPTE